MFAERGYCVVRQLFSADDVARIAAAFDGLLGGASGYEGGRAAAKRHWKQAMKEQKAARAKTPAKKPKKAKGPATEGKR